MKFNIGDLVAASMQEIVSSEEHSKMFKKADAPCQTCKCGNCNDSCPCIKGGDCCDGCKGCAKAKEAANDDKENCGDLKMGTTINEIINTLAKIASIQDEIGLTTSSLSTLKAMSEMVKEMNKIAEDVDQDSNEVKIKESIEPFNQDSDTRRDWKQFAEEFPEEWELLKKRVDESHMGETSSPSNLFDYVGPEGADTEPPPDTILDTEIPPESLIGMNRLPSHDKITDFENLLQGEDSSEHNDIIGNGYGVDRPTVFTGAKKAFDRLENWMKRAEYDDPDFEDESDFNQPTRHKKDQYLWKRPFLKGYELEDMKDLEDPDYLPHEDEVESMPDLFGLEPEIDPEDLSHADDLMWASDLDGELESGDFLESPDDDDDDDGFDYSGPDKHKPSWMEDNIRMPGGKSVSYDEMSPEEKLEHEMGAGLHERLDMDPDELSHEDIYGDGEFDD